MAQSLDDSLGYLIPTAPTTTLATWLAGNSHETSTPFTRQESSSISHLCFRGWYCHPQMVCFPLGKSTKSTDCTTPCGRRPQGTRGGLGATGATSDPYAPVKRSIVFKHSSQLPLLAASGRNGRLLAFLGPIFKGDVGIISPQHMNIWPHNLAILVQKYQR